MGFPDRNPLRSGVGTLPTFEPVWPLQFFHPPSEREVRDALSDMSTRKWERPTVSLSLEGEFGKHSEEMLVAAVAMKLRTIAEARWAATKSANPHWKFRAELSRTNHCLCELWLFRHEPRATVSFAYDPRNNSRVLYILDAGDVVLALGPNSPFLPNAVRTI